MKTIILSFCLIIFFLMNGYSQTNDSILVKNGRKYTLNQKPIYSSQLKSIYSNCPEAMKEYKMGNSLKNSGTVMFLGGLAYAALSSSVIKIKRENDYTNWFNNSSYYSSRVFDDSKYLSQIRTNMGIGLGVSVIGLILNVSAPIHFKKAVILYNIRNKVISSIPVQLNFVYNSNGLGFRMNF